MCFNGIGDRRLVYISIRNFLVSKLNIRKKLLNNHKQIWTSSLCVPRHVPIMLSIAVFRYCCLALERLPYFMLFPLMQF